MILLIIFLNIHHKLAIVFILWFIINANIISGVNMIIQSISSSNLNAPNRQKINFNSANSMQDSISESVNTNNTKEDDKNKLKKTYWKGVLSGIIFSVLVIGGDRLIEYLIKKNSPKLK